MVDVRTGAEQTTNDFRFTWCQERGKESAGLRHVVPKTYKGAFFWTMFCFFLIFVPFRSGVGLILTVLFLVGLGRGDALA